MRTLAVSLLCLVGALTQAQQVVFTDSIRFSHPSGFYRQGFDLQMWCSDNDAEIHFTTDGSLPTQADDRYHQPLHFCSSEKPAATISYVRTATEWQQPEGAVNTYPVICAQAFKNNQPVSPLYRHIYFVEPAGPTRYSMPVVSIITAPGNLFNADSGIYVLGNNANSLQHGDDWEREAHILFFDSMGNTVAEQNCGLRITGQITRNYAQKILRLYARPQYGKATFNHPFFGADNDSVFYRLALRTMQADWNDMAFSDDLAQEICHGMLGADYLRRRFVIVFINGEYWGIHSLREVLHEQDLARRFHLDKDNIDLLSNAYLPANGTNYFYLQLLDFIKTHSLQDSANYAYAASEIDLPELCDYFITEIVCANTDWGKNNTVYWHCYQPASKWRWIVSDMDGSFKMTWLNSLNFIYAPERAQQPVNTEFGFEVIQALMANRNFRDLFKQRFLYHLNNTFSPARTLPVLEQMKKEFGAEQPEHTHRWGFPANTYRWRTAVENAAGFLVQRPLFMLQEFTRLVGNPLRVYPNPATNLIGAEIISEKNQNAEALLIDAYGNRLSLGYAGLTEGKNYISFNTPPALAAATYLLLVETENNLFSTTVVIVK